MKLSISESDKTKIADSYCKAISVLYNQGDITDDEIDHFATDIRFLKDLVNSFTWHLLDHVSVEQQVEAVSNILQDNIETELTRQWVLAHINKGYFSLLERSVRMMQNYIIKVIVQVPHYISLDKENRRERIIQEFVDKYTINGVKRIVNIIFEKIHGKEVHEKVKEMADNMFDLEIESISDKSL